MDFKWWICLRGISYVVQIKLSVLLEGLQVLRGERWLLTSCYISEWEYNKTHLLYALWSVSYTSNRTPWTVVPGVHGTHYKHNPLVSSLVSNNNLSLLTYGCMRVGMLGHIPKYIGKTSNNNKILINNSFYCFTIQVVYTRILVKWGIRYIDKGFFVWIIPSMYLSHEAVNWASTINFACIQFY